MGMEVVIEANENSKPNALYVIKINLENELKTIIFYDLLKNICGQAQRLIV